jgi:ferredoxin
MNPVNNAALIRRELMVRLARLTFRGELEEKIDRIPLEMFPRTRTPIRCCIHKDRAVIRDRIRALLGFGIETEEDELTTLAAYARTALTRQRPEPEVLTVLDEACSACVQSRYFVTNACRGCMARPCTLNCPKDAIRMVQGRAQIDTKNVSTAVSA